MPSRPNPFGYIVIRDTDQSQENPEEYLRIQFPDWVIVNLSYPLRTSKNLSDEVKIQRSKFLMILTLTTSTVQ